jgi:glucose-specific phosphotransferase system IIA component
MMGDGMAVWQEDAEVCAPVDGVLTMVADTKHAFGITTANDAQILVHVGLETVELGGEGFEQVRSQGEQVKAGDVILKVDLALMKEKGIAMAVPVLLIPEDEERTLKKTEAKKAIGHETLLFQVS